MGVKRCNERERLRRFVSVGVLQPSSSQSPRTFPLVVMHIGGLNGCQTTLHARVGLVVNNPPNNT